MPAKGADDNLKTLLKKGNRYVDAGSLVAASNMYTRLSKVYAASDDSKKDVKTYDAIVHLCHRINYRDFNNKCSEFYEYINGNNLAEARKVHADMDIIYQKLPLELKEKVQKTFFDAKELLQ